MLWNFLHIMTFIHHPSPLDPERLRALATTINLAHRALGTQLEAIEESAVVLKLGWRQELTDASGRFATGLMTTLLDHACSLAAVLYLTEERRFVATTSLRVDYLRTSTPKSGLLVRGEVIDEGEATLLLRGQAYELADPTISLAIAHSSVATTQ
jgi:uncharacterized protein (TIGR00369 family)